MLIEVKKHRRMQGITQSQLAAAVGVSQASVSQWEHGKMMPGCGTLVKIAEALNCQVGDLLAPCSNNYELTKSRPEGRHAKE